MKHAKYIRNKLVVEVNLPISSLNWAQLMKEKKDCSLLMRSKVEIFHANLFHLLKKAFYWPCKMVFWQVFRLTV